MRNLLLAFAVILLACACTSVPNPPAPPPSPAPLPPTPEPEPNPYPPHAQSEHERFIESGVPEPVNPEQMLDLRIQVALRDEPGLDRFLQDALDPRSPHFGETLTPAEFRKRFLPTADQMRKVRKALEKSGMEVEQRAHGSVLRAKASTEVAEHAFNTRLSHMRGPQGRDIRVLSAPLGIPPELRIESIQGLVSPPPRKAHNVRRPATKVPAYIGPMNAAMMRRTYNIPDKARGSGQTIGIIALDSYKEEDVFAYADANHLPRPKLKNIWVDGYKGEITGGDTQAEITMDIELVHAIAPDADEIRIYSAAQTDTAFFDLWNEAANPTLGDKKLIKVISCSWGAPEAHLTPLDVQAEATLFKQMAAQGQTVFAASGDNGAKDNGFDLGTDDPASQPYVVGVGGTHVTAPGGVWGSETAWTDGGGGVSAFWPMPEWQRSSVSRGALMSETFRGVPDVALCADPASGYSIRVRNSWQTLGGTSCAAPMWASFLALVNERRSENGKPPLPFLSPILYRLMQTPEGRRGMHDIADGSSNGWYVAVPGRDLVTGWGSLDGKILMDALAGST